jgi:Dolichyl-phosphate-mannose-protein mannosyltransferase
MTVRQSLLAISLIAALHALFFIWYQRPDWNTQWTDQGGYRQLGEVLANTGKFTRYPDSPTFVPEVIRTPGYPLFVALVYRIAGVHQLPVALAQMALFVGICLLVYATARMLAPPSLALAASAVTALYPPIPFFGALVLTEVLATFLFTAGMWAVVRAVHHRSAGMFAFAGFLFGACALTRPVFFLFPVALAMVGLILLPLFGVRPRPRLIDWTALVAVSCLMLLPWFSYNYVTLGRFTMSPAGGVGRGIFEGSWQAVWPGRLQNELTTTADAVRDPSALNARVDAIAEREHLDPRPMVEYVHQWTDIRKIWEDPTDPHERATARVAADAEYLRVGLSNIARQSAGQLAKRLARGVFILWAGEIPFRYSSINQLPPIVVRLCWAVQAVLMGAALAGLVLLARTGRLLDACLLGAPILYITAVHMLLLTEARQSLPDKPMVMLLAVMAFQLLSLKSQVHEAQHLG